MIIKILLVLYQNSCNTIQNLCYNLCWHRWFFSFIPNLVNIYKCIILCTECKTPPEQFDQLRNPLWLYFRMFIHCKGIHVTFLFNCRHIKLMCSCFQCSNFQKGTNFFSANLQNGRSVLPPYLPVLRPIRLPRSFYKYPVSGIHSEYRNPG